MLEDDRVTRFDRAVRRDQPRRDGRLEGGRDERRRTRDEAVEDDRDARLRGADDDPDEQRDLEAADGLPGRRSGPADPGC